ncbi:hypothetical protein predicted by Glimmer/Critica [Acetobacter senegalensis]|uniref:Uncharacterized protein n=1 Tax=Acetobacter senegalensis TaxID=446692 RepID=A0A0U5EW78_9PROT|nr:hypothetical protein predicted by Glimmer/Critica [Acetobacter senegalensis]
MAGWLCQGSDEFFQGSERLYNPKRYYLDGVRNINYGDREEGRKHAVGVAWRYQ